MKYVRKIAELKNAKLKKDQMKNYKSNHKTKEDITRDTRFYFY